jgi:hypothetical protein
LFPLIPTSFQQFSEKECGKPQGTIEAMQQTCVFSRFALEKVRVLTINEFSRELNEKLLSAAVAFKNLLAFFFC